MYLVNNHGQKLGEGRVEKILRKPNKTHIARVKSFNLHGDDLMEVRGFITRRLPYLGVNGGHLPMMIDRRNYKDFSAVYGQQLAETGQVIGCASPAIEPEQTDYISQWVLLHLWLSRKK